MLVCGDAEQLSNPLTPAELLAFNQSEQRSWKPVIEEIARYP